MRYMVLPVSFRWDEGFVRRIDEARGDVPRSRFVRRAVEQALEAAAGGSAFSVSNPRRSSDEKSTRVADPPAPAEQPRGYRVVDEGVSVVPVIPPGGEPVIPVFSSRVRSSSVARPFRPAPKGKP